MQIYFFPLVCIKWNQTETSNLSEQAGRCSQNKQTEQKRNEVEWDNENVQGRKGKTIQSTGRRALSCRCGLVNRWFKNLKRSRYSGLRAVNRPKATGTHWTAVRVWLNFHRWFPNRFRLQCGRENSGKDCLDLATVTKPFSKKKGSDDLESSKSQVRSKRDSMEQFPNRLFCLNRSENETYTIILCFMNVKINARQKKWGGIESSAKHKKGEKPSRLIPQRAVRPPNLYYN